MNTESKQRWHHHFKKTDVIAAAQLASLTTKDVIDMAEQMHVSVLQKLPTPNWLMYSTRFVYSGIKALPLAAHAALKPLAQYVHSTDIRDNSNHTSERLAVIAALNGVFGDQFKENHNPLAIPMQLIKPSIEHHSLKLLFIHGLCMDNRSWDKAHTENLATEIGADVWQLKYNTGLPIKLNGQQLDELLNIELQGDQSLIIIGHSMGGLVALNALISSLKSNHNWYSQTQALTTLGTPFAGAPLAHWGHWVEEQLSAFSFTLPLTVLTKRRSQGIHDLRHGFEDDLPRNFNIPTYCIAGHIDTKSHKAINEVVGDGLVTEQSALAMPSVIHTWVAENIGHLKLQKSNLVYEQLKKWLKNN
jgi:pimeloyl-ACP methyl ester carboxylesterase